MDKKIGIIACDIDGTISFDGISIDPTVISFFTTLIDRGWVLLFATGRTNTWANTLLSQYFFTSYYIASCNGASLARYENKQKTILYSLGYSSHIISSSLRAIVESIGVVLYEEGKDARIFSTPLFYSQQIHQHLKKRKIAQKETWIELASIGDLPSDVRHIVSARFFMKRDEIPTCQLLLQRAVFKDQICLSSMKDSFDPAIKIIQLTAPHATKSRPCQTLQNIYGCLPVIAIGDDMNDCPMFDIANTAIAMSHAEQQVQKKADIVTHDMTACSFCEAVIKAIEHNGC